MRKNLKLLMALFLGIPVLVIAALYLLVKPSQLAPVLNQQLSRSLKRSATVEGLRFHLFPPGFTAQNLVISDDPAFSKEPFLKARSIEIKPALLPLLGGTLEILSIRLSQPQVELIQNEANTWNFNSIGSNSSQSGNKLELNALTIDNATVGLKQPGASRSQYSNLSAELRDYSEGKPFSLKLSALMSSGKSISAEGKITTASGKSTFSDLTLGFASLKGTLNGEFSSASMNLILKIPKSPIADAAPLFLPASTTVKGDVVANLSITGNPKQPKLQGRLDLTGFEVSGGDIKQPVRTAKLGIALSPERIMLEPANITSGSTALQTFGVISSYATDPKLEATLIAPNAQLAELLAIARAYGATAVDGVSATGQATLQVRAHGPLTGKTPLSFNGSGSLRNAEIQLPTLNKPLAIATTDFRFEANGASLSGVNARLGGTTVLGSMNLASNNIGFDLQADRVVLDELRSLFKDQKASGPSKLNAKGSIRIGTLQLAELTLTQLSAQANFHNGQLALNPLVASLYGGRHTGSMDIDFRPAKPLYSMNSKLEKIESSLLLAAATSLKGIISGPLSANLNLSFSPADPIQIARSLNGTISLNFSQGKIASFNLINELSSLAKFLGFNGSGEKFTQFVGLSGDLRLDSGNATTQNLKLELANLSAALTGQMNLADQTLDLKLLSILDKRFSEQVGGNKIGGFLTAAMANQNGNLLIPASIKGTFARPIIAPDPGALAKMKLQSFNPKNPEQMIDSINNIFDLFKKKKP